MCVTTDQVQLIVSCELVTIQGTPFTGCSVINQVHTGSEKPPGNKSFLKKYTGSLYTKITLCQKIFVFNSSTVWGGFTIFLFYKI